MKRRRVKITGIGPVTAAGVGRDAFWQGILEPLSRVRSYPDLGDEFGPLVAAYIDTFDVTDYIDRNAVPKAASRQSQFAIAGAVLALQDAGISLEELRAAGPAIVTGSSLMDLGGIGHAIESVQKRGMRGAQPRLLYAMGIGSVPSAINSALGLTARTLSVSTQCDAGMDAIGQAAELVATGRTDLVVCGGAEAPLNRFPLVELRASQLTPATTEMPERISRPFDMWRTTGVPSEGACFFVLEPETSQRPGYSYVAGYAGGTDENGDVCSGLVTSGKLAMAEAGVRAAEIDAIFAWGPGHKAVDSGEAKALQRLFNGGLGQIPAVSICGAIGTSLGAAPAIQLGAAALAQRMETLPPTVNWDYPDPSCPLNLCNRARAIPQRLALLNAHGAGGVNASLVLARC